MSPDERRPKEDGGHARRTYSLDEVTRGYLEGIPEKQRSETVEDGVFLGSLLTKDDMKAFEGIRAEREGRRRKVAKQRRI